MHDSEDGAAATDAAAGDGVPLGIEHIPGAISPEEAAKRGPVQVTGPHPLAVQARLRARDAAQGQGPPQQLDPANMTGRQVLDHLKQRLAGQEGGQRQGLLKAINRISEEYNRLEAEVDLLFEAWQEAEEKLQLFADRD